MTMSPLHSNYDPAEPRSGHIRHSVQLDPSIIFNIKSEKSNGLSILTCDHSRERFAQNLNIYTVYEGHEFTIVTKYEETINYIICYGLTNRQLIFEFNSKNKNVVTFSAEKRMGTSWKCYILAHRDNAVIQPVYQYENHNYSATCCYMKIHVRRKVASQMILVNNMELPAVRTNLSEKDVDFRVEYHQYGDGDVVNVICINKQSDKMLTMEYKMAGTMSDEFIMDDLKSSKMIGFVTKLHSGHNNSYMICTRTEEDDYTKVMVKFVMRTKFNNIVFLKINGITLKPCFHIQTFNQYRIDYKYVSNQEINVTCEVERTDVKLLVFDEDFAKVRSYNKTELIKNKKAEMRFYLSGVDTKKEIQCGINYLNGTSAETVTIYFTAADFPIDSYPLHMELPSNGRVMELYNDYKLNVIYYEFNNGETLQLKCGELRLPPQPGPVLYLELDSKKCETNGCSVSKTLAVTRKDENTATACYLKEVHNPSDPGPSFTVLRQLRVILRERVLTTTTSTTTTAPTINHTAANPTTSGTPTSSSYPPHTLNIPYYTVTQLCGLAAIGVVMITIILVVLYYTIAKKRSCGRSGASIPAPRIDPSTVFYENLLAVFRPINEREAAELEESYYEEIK